MNTLEDRIRAAVVQTAGEVAPGSIRPLSLNGHAAFGRRTRAGRAAQAGRGSARWPRVLIPVAAAASVIAVVAISLAVTGGRIGGGPAVSRGRAGHSRTHGAPQIISAAGRAAIARAPEW
jgi:hypothetical protein